MHTINPNECYKTKCNILKHFHLNVSVQQVLACIYHNILHSTSNMYILAAIMDIWWTNDW